MPISDEIARVEREFVPGEVLFLAVMAQENLNELHTASWFLRNIQALEALPMLEFNAELRDFRKIDTPWAGDVFCDFTVGVKNDFGPVSWDEMGDGYLGGWLSSDLKRFFSIVGVSYPSDDIDRILSEPVRKVLYPRTEIRSDRRKVDDFLAERGHDFLAVEDWLKTVGGDIAQVGIALRLAFEEVHGFLPLYYQDTAIDPVLPLRMEAKDAAGAWGDMLVSFGVDMMPDCFYGDRSDATRWTSFTFVRKADCAEFNRRTGLGEKFHKHSGGALEAGLLDLAASRARESKPAKSNTELADTGAVKAAPPAREERDLGRRERTTLLAMIAILCKEAKLDFTRPAKTAGLIQGMGDAMGLNIGETTIEMHLKKIPDAIASRMR